MATATAKDVKKSLVPRRIRSRIDAAFVALQEHHALPGDTPEDRKKRDKKFDQDRKEVLSYIEGLIVPSAG